MRCTPASRLLLTLGLLAAAPAARADYPHDAGLGGVAVTAVVSDQQSPSICPDGAGGSIVVWNDYRSGGTNSYDIYAQRLDPRGRPLWGANGVPVCTDPASQNLPLAVSDGAGGVVLAWQDQRASGSGPGIYAQRLNASGVAQWAANGIRVFSQPTVNYEHAAASDGAGGMYLAAYRDTTVGFTTRLLHVQRVLATGALPWGPSGTLVRAGAVPTPLPSIIADGTGGAIVAFRTAPFLGLEDVYVQRFNASGTALWSAGGVLATESTRSQSKPRVASDGAGGAYVIFEDASAGSTTIVANRVDAAGTLLWGQAGLTVAPPGSGVVQNTARIVADGAGGALVVLDDNRSGSSNLYAQRIGPFGAPLWDPAGLPLTFGTDDRTVQSLTPDGLGGLVVLWTDGRLGSGDDLFAQRLTGSGQALWAYNGLLVTRTSGADARAAATADGAGGVFVTWDVSSIGLGFDILAQRVDAWSYLGFNAPAITSVRDVANDQGGRVKVSWDASWLDTNVYGGLQQYRVWRSVPTSGPFAAAALARGIATSSDAAASAGRWLADPNGALDYAWELVGAQAAAQLPGYSFVAPTGGDSVAGSFPRTAFRVEAMAGTAPSSPRWWSAPDSGYSVDDLAPAAPAQFTGIHASGTSSLTWNANTEADLAEYRLHRGSTAGFTPSASNLVATLGGVEYVDSPGGPFVYKLVAVDVHGNESPAATWIPGGLLDAGMPLVGGFALAAAAPNPARGATTLRFALPAPGRVRLALYDAGGRCVRTLRDGDVAAGEHAERIELRDDAGRALAPGMYLVRLSGPLGERTRRIVAVR